MKVKKDKLTEGFMKLMTDMGAVFIDVTLEKKAKKLKQKEFLPKIKKY